MLTYSQLRGWRNLCEFLNERHYKFATPEIITKKCPGVLPNLYQPKLKTHREFLYNNYLIQFVTWSQYPLLNYTSNKSTWREWRDVWGWRLCSDWEHKIDYLEQIVLFGNEPNFKPWESALRQRIHQRQERQKKLDLERQLRKMKERDRRQECAQLGICWRCLSPIIPLMGDCVRCGALQED